MPGQAHYIKGEDEEGKRGGIRKRGETAKHPHGVDQSPSSE